VNAIHRTIGRPGVRVALASFVLVAATCPGLAIGLGQPQVRAALLVVPVPDAMTMKHDRTAVVAAPGVLGNDIGLLGSTTAVLVSGPSHGSLALYPDGGYAYLPDPGYVGIDVFRYRPTGAVSTSTTDTITITDAVPVAAPDTYAAAAGSARIVAAPGVLANDGDADGDQLSASLVTGVSHGSLSLDAGGGFTYMATPGYSGADSFTYRAWDGAAWSARAAVSVTVTRPTPAPSATPIPTLPVPALPVPTPSLPLPLPTLPLPSPPLPSVLPTPSQTPVPASTPRSRQSSSPSLPPLSSLTASPSPSASSGVGVPGGPTTPPGTGVAGQPQRSGGRVAVDVRDGALTRDDFVLGALGGLDSVGLWVLPAVFVGVPGLLVIVWVAIQVAAGLAWLPAARRMRGDAGPRLRARRMRADQG
jgi:hypothetical protein